MYTARLLTVSPSMHCTGGGSALLGDLLARGVCLAGGVCLARRGVCLATGVSAVRGLVFQHALRQNLPL